MKYFVDLTQEYWLMAKPFELTILLAPRRCAPTPNKGANINKNIQQQHLNPKLDKNKMTSVILLNSSTSKM